MTKHQVLFFGLKKGGPKHINSLNSPPTPCPLCSGNVFRSDKGQRGVTTRILLCYANKQHNYGLKLQGVFLVLSKVILFREGVINTFIRKYWCHFFPEARLFLYLALKLSKFFCILKAKYQNGRA